MAVALAMVMIPFVIFTPLESKESSKREFPYYTDPVDGWEFGFWGKQVRFDEARRYVELARQPLVGAAIKAFGRKGLLYRQVYSQPDKLYFGCYLNHNGHVLRITDKIGMTVRISDRTATSTACFLVDSIECQDWMWDSRKPGRTTSITLNAQTIEQLEHSPWKWVYVFVMFDKAEGFEGISDIDEVTEVTGVEVKKRGALELSPNEKDVQGQGGG